MTADGNIVKRVCKELNITQRELADRIGMSEAAYDPRYRLAK